MIEVEPIIVPIVGYDLKRKEVITDIRFVGTVPAGAVLDMLRATNANGDVDYTAALDYLDNCVYPDDREKWHELLHGTKITVSMATLLLVYTAIGEQYTKRPTKQRSGSRGGRSSTKPTTRAAASSRASRASVGR